MNFAKKIRVVLMNPQILSLSLLLR